MRSFNGDIEYSHIDMLDGLFELSQVLTQNTSTHIPSLITSINLAVEKALVFDYDIAKRINLSILYDLHLIFCHKFHIVRTLFKLNEFLGSENISEFMKDVKINRKIEFARKKVFFYMCYIKSIPQNDLKNIADEILKVYQDRKTMKTL